MEHKCIEGITAATAATFVMMTICAGLSLGFNILFGGAYMDVYTSQVFWAKYWVDIIPHFLGGAAVGWLVVFLDLRFNPLPYCKPLARLAASVLAIIIGVGWEIYEVEVGYDVFQAQWYAGGMIGVHGDQMKDVIVDCLGALAVINVTAPVMRSLLKPLLPGLRWNGFCLERC